MLLTIKKIWEATKIYSVKMMGVLSLDGLEQLYQEQYNGL
jgi:hypothetical protein